jgi:hypothetical protein
VEGAREGLRRRAALTKTARSKGKGRRQRNDEAAANTCPNLNLDLVLLSPFPFDPAVASRSYDRRHGESERAAGAAP